MILKCVKNLLKKLRAVKSTNHTTSSLIQANILIIRKTFTDESTIGKLFLNGEKMCDTLELPYRDNQRRISCIPAGEYKARLRYPRESGSRDYLHILVKDVPNRDYILFHRGNNASHSRGCILVGLKSEHNVVYNSTLALELLLKEIINLGVTEMNLIIKNK
jgi:hypothetical protein